MPFPLSLSIPLRRSSSHSRSSTPTPSHTNNALSPTTISSLPTPYDTDAQVWHKMLSLQRRYKCYNSARLEAAVEAVDRWGFSEEDVGVPSRLCLDLLNEGLRTQILASGRDFVYEYSHGSEW